MRKQIAIFVFGLTSPILVHISQIIIGFIFPSRRGGVMSGIIDSFPSNLLALALFLGTGYYLWKLHSKENKSENKLREDVQELIKEIKQERNERNSKPK